MNYTISAFCVRSFAHGLLISGSDLKLDAALPSSFFGQYTVSFNEFETLQKLKDNLIARWDGKSGAILGAGLDADPYHIQKFTQIMAINGRSCAHYHFDRIKKLIPTLLEAGSIEITFLAPGICEPLESKLGYRSSTSLCAKST